MKLETKTQYKRREKIFSVGLLFIVLVGIGLRIAYVNRPLDHRLRSPWRQADYTQIARNFYREGMNIFYPRIDWRGDTPGYAEMEFPFLPWVGALLYRFFGYHEQFLRGLSALFGIGSLLLFLRLSLKVLPPIGTIFATTAFALNPLLIHLATSIQPESLVLFLSLVAIGLIWRWDANPKFSTLLGASAVIAGAILAKTPAAYLGLILAYVILRKYGMKAFTDIRVYIAGLVALLPPLAWYIWAARFWMLYGNSLGVSNESHLIGWDMLIPPMFLIGNLKWETLGVFTPTGWLLALAALRTSRIQIKPFLVWYGAVWVFYLIAARTSGDDWAFYYHSASIAPACLLMGAGIVAFANGEVFPRGWTWLAQRERWIGGVLATGTILALIGATVIIIRMRDGRTDLLAMRTCALEFVQHVPVTELIVVRGGGMFDEYGQPVAHNESMVFAWMDRKGFTYGDEELGIETLDRIAARGGRYWMVRRNELQRGNLQELVDQRYRLVAECALGYALYDLRR